MRIVLDAMGSDTCPGPELAAALAAAKEFRDEIILVGPEELLNSKLRTMDDGTSLVKIINASEIITMEDKGLQLALKVKRKGSLTSMAVGIDLLKNGEADAFITAGNTGGALATSYFRLGMIPGIELPGLTALFPVKDGFCTVLDIGANPECKPENLVQFAIMGSIYSQKVRGVKNPRIGLLSNGEEAGKGNELVKATYPLLEKSSLNFYGNIEGKELFNGEVDVAVMDGFSGNVLLKSSEAAAKLLADILKEKLTSSLRNKIGALLAKPALIELKQALNPDEVGAAPLLGVNGLVFIGHGRSNPHALFSAIRTARQSVQANLLEEIQTSVEENLDLLN